MMGIFLNFTELRKTSNTNKNKQTQGAKVLSQKGKSPDFKLKSLNIL